METFLVNEDTSQKYRTEKITALLLRNGAHTLTSVLPIRHSSATRIGGPRNKAKHLLEGEEYITSEERSVGEGADTHRLCCSC